MMQVRFLNAEGTMVEAVIDGVAYSVPLDADNEIAGRVRAWIADGNTPTPFTLPGPSQNEIAQIVTDSFRASLRRKADALEAQGRTYEAVKLLMKAGV